MKANLWLQQPHAFIQQIVIALFLIAALPAAWSQSIMSDPANGATGVSPSAAVTFTFSSAVDPTKTTATFLSTNGAFYAVNTSWNAADTVLTCMPVSPFPTNATINWIVVVQGTLVFAQGSFSTGTGPGGGGGSGTNAITTFVVGKVYLYQQTSTAAPTALATTPYTFSTTVGLASNRVATAVTETFAGSTSPTNLTQTPLHPESYFFYAFSTDQMAIETNYPQGNYVINVTGTPANLQVTVNLPTTMAQPNAPHLSNFAASQTVNAAQAFMVTWDAFQGGAGADVIGLSLSSSNGVVVFQTAGPGVGGALPGTATSVNIPVGTLAANSGYTAQLVFYRFVAVSNSTYATLAYRATGTQFTLNTAGSSSGPPPQVSNPIWSGNGFGFDVATSPGQTLKVRFSTDLSLPISQWQTLLTTNSPGSNVHIVVPVQAGAVGFVRLEN